MFEHIYGHDYIKSYLIKTLENNTLSNAYLFAGPSYVGKYSLALEFAKEILGKHYFNTSEDVLNFPDLIISFPFLKKDLDKNIHFYIEALRDYLIKNGYPKHLKGNESIPIDLIREIIMYANKRPYIAKKKVIIIKNIEKMRKESANSFLKLLEEPPLNTIIILTTDNVNSILPTILSRCQVMRFGYLNDNNIKEYFKNEKYLDNIDDYLWFFNGTLANADIFIDSENKINEEKIIEEFLSGNSNYIFELLSKSEKKEKNEYKNFIINFYILLLQRLFNNYLLEKDSQYKKFYPLIENYYSRDSVYNLIEELSNIQSDIRRNIDIKTIINYIVRIFSIYKTTKR